MSDINTLITTVRDIMVRIRININAGTLIQVDEVGPTSFVQIMQAVPLIPGKPEPVGWEYNQFWVDKSPQLVQDKLVGAYTNEWIGKLKIIGIFENVER